MAANVDGFIDLSSLYTLANLKVYAIVLMTGSANQYEITVKDPAAPENDGVTLPNLLEGGTLLHDPNDICLHILKKGGYVVPTVHRALVEWDKTLNAVLNPNLTKMNAVLTPRVSGNQFITGNVISVVDVLMWATLTEIGAGERAANCSNALNAWYNRVAAVRGCQLAYTGMWGKTLTQHYLQNAEQDQSALVDLRIAHAEDDVELKEIFETLFPHLLLDAARKLVNNGDSG